MLVVKDLTKIYRLGKIEIKALVNLSLEIHEGDMVCIMGKSGSGKSTLLRQLGLIDSPTEGTIVFNRVDVTRIPDFKKAHIRLKSLGYVFQEYALIQELTILENVYLPAIMLGKNRRHYKKKAIEMLDRVDLKDKINNRPSELSGGQKQRVAIARALINDPRILFADEPCANLDTVSTKNIMEILVRLNKDFNVAVIFVSHDPDDQQYAKKHLYIKDGKAVEKYF